VLRRGRRGAGRQGDRAVATQPEWQPLTGGQAERQPLIGRGLEVVGAGRASGLEVKGLGGREARAGD